MNDEIKVGEYIRNKGFIAKVVYKDDDCIECDDYININALEYEESIFIFKHDLEECEIKHSPNIIELIEVGDLVNGKYIVADIHSYGFYYLEDGGASQNQIDVSDIKTIVTKEQIEKIMYRVGE